MHMSASPQPRQPQPRPQTKSTLRRLPAVLLTALALALGSAAPARAQQQKLEYQPTPQQVAQDARVFCPPAGFDSVPGFDIEAYIEESWFVQAQVPLVYQSTSQLFCVKATYKPINPSKPGAGLYVYNYANQDRVNGPSMGTTSPDSPFKLLALPESSGRTWFDERLDKARATWGSRLGSAADTDASKLEVGPATLSRNRLVRAASFGPYWVVAVGTSNTTAGMPTGRPEYTWAVVSGGPPMFESNGACSTFLPGVPTDQQYRGGLWLFARKEVDPDAAAAARAAAEELGFDMTQLVDVEQDNCTYAGSVDA